MVKLYGDTRGIMPNSGFSQSDNKFSSLGIVLVFSSACLIVFILLLIKPFFDPDFYWHLKTGEWIWAHKTLPLFDPFTVDPQPLQTDRSIFLLSSYWLFQILLHAFYKINGFGGIVFFRFVLGILLIYAVCRFTNNKNLLTATVAATGLCQIFSTQFPERPQFISFLCIAVLLSTLLSYLAHKDRSLISLASVLCLTMLAWANMHGGFILGQSLLLLVLLTETAKFIHPKLSPLTKKEFVTLAAAICAALLVSLVNPNPILSFRILFSAGETGNILYSSNLEYSNLWEYFKEMHDHIPFIALGSYILTMGVCYRSRERTNITWLAILFVFGYMGACHIRYYPFFVIATTLFAMRYIETEQVGKTAKTVIAVVFFTVAACSLLEVPRSIDRLGKYGWIPASYFPVAVCDYIVANDLRGNVFTTTDWGGYALWKLSPERKVFSDGRQLFPSRFLENLSSQEGGGNEYFWRSLVDKYNVQIVILPLLAYDYKPYHLTDVLKKDSGWRQISQGNNGVAFMRKP